MFSAVFVFQVFRLFKVPKKFRKKYIKNQRPGSFRKNQRREAGPPPGRQKGPWRGPTLGHAGHPPGCPVGPLDALLRLYLALRVETPKRRTLFRETLSVTPPPSFQDRGCLEKLLRHPAGTGKCPWIHLHRRCFPPP